MGQNTITFGVTKDHAIPIEPPLGGTALVQNLSGATLNIADDSQMSVDVSTITAGSSATFTTPQFMKSQGALSSVLVTLTDASTGLGAFLSGNPADDTKAISAGTGIKIPPALLSGSSGDDTKALSAGTGLKIAPALLSGNVGDDGFALSAGTGQHLSLSGISPAAFLAADVWTSVLTFGPGGANAPDGSYTLLSTATRRVGDGNATLLSAVYSTLAAAQAVYPFATALTQTVDYCAVQSALTSFDGIVKPVGATLLFPRGFYSMGNSLLSVPHVGDNAPLVMMGANGWGSEPDYGGVSKLVWTSDVTGPPHDTYAIDATICQRFVMVGMTMLGPLLHAFNDGRMPCTLAGVRVQGRHFFHKCSFGQFSTCVGMGGGVSGGFPVNKGFDHSVMSNCFMGYCGYGINLLPGSTAAGDQHWIDLQIHAACASVAIANSASSGFTGSTIQSSGFYSPVGIYMYDDGSASSGQFVGNQLDTVSFELSYNGAIFAQKWQTNGLITKNSLTYFPQSPNNSLNGWASPTFAVSSSTFGGGSPNQITITANTGEYWQVGMTVAGTGVAAGSTVTAVNGNTTGPTVDAGWPYTNPTLTLSINLTADPTGNSLQIVQPKVGHISAKTIENNVAPTFSSQIGIFSCFATGSGGIISDNQCFDTDNVVNGAVAFPLTTGPSYGNSWGGPATTCFIGSSQLAAGVSCTAGDLLHWAAGNKTVAIADGTRPLAGFAILTTATAGNVDFYINAMTANPATVRNKTAGTIAANALIKLDLANPGGVTTATSLTDGTVVGCNNAVAITAGTSATVDYVKIM